LATILILQKIAYKHDYLKVNTEGITVDIRVWSTEYRKYQKMRIAYKSFERVQKWQKKRKYLFLKKLRTD
jgi:hypothetical protein